MTSFFLRWFSDAMQVQVSHPREATVAFTECVFAHRLIVDLTKVFSKGFTASTSTMTTALQISSFVLISDAQTDFFTAQEHHRRSKTSVTFIPFCNLSAAKRGPKFKANGVWTR